MKTIILISLFLFLNLQAQTLKAGMWKGKVNFKINGLPLPAKEDEDCILPHEVKDVKASIVKNLKKQGCELTKWVITGNKLDAALTCKSKDLDAQGTLSGQFSENNYQLKGNANGTFKEMLPAQADIELQGNWTGACSK